MKWILLCEYTRTSLGDTSEVGRSSNHTTEMNTPVDNDTNLSMTDKTPNHSLEEGFDVNQDDGDVLNDIIVLNSHHTINMITEGLDNSMTDKIADDSLEPNAEGQPNETMPFHMIRNKSFFLFQL